MEIWLQSQDTFNTLARLDPSTGEYSLIDRGTPGASVPGKADGIFAILNDKLAGLYVLNDRLLFQLEHEAFELDDETTVEVSGPDNHRLLRVIRQGTPVAKHVYGVTAQRFADDPTPMIDDEDFDFGLVASHISKDASRKRVMLGLE